MHQQNHIGAAIFIKHFQKHYLSQLSSIEDSKMKVKEGTGCESEKQTKQEDSFTQNTNQVSISNSTNKFDQSRESVLKSFQQQNQVGKGELYEKSDYNINNMTESQLKYANSLMEKIKNPK